MPLSLVETLPPLGIALIVIGVSLILLCKTRFYVAFIKAREQMIANVQIAAGTTNVARLKHEILILRQRVPRFGYGFLVLGILVSVASLLVR